MSSDAPLAIDLRDFSFAYPPDPDTSGAPYVCRHLSWQVPRGAFALLVGETGSGKTTLLRCLKPELAPAGSRGGDVALFGTSFSDLDVRASAATVGFVSQSPDNQLVCDTVESEMAFGLENLAVPQDEMHRHVAEVAHFFGIEGWMHRPCASLSGGQKQVVNLAAVLAMQPRLLLLDEPTARLDPVAATTFLHALFRINRELGITICVATHAPHAAADYATACFELSRGRVGVVPLERFRGAEAPADVLRARERLRPSCAEPGGPDDDVSAAEEPVVDLNDVYVRYAAGEPWVLRGCDLAVRAGEVRALVGGNGCGKTTLLRTVAGVLDCGRGRARNALADAQALLPQDLRALFVCDTLRAELGEWGERCGYGADAVSAALGRVGLSNCPDRHPFDLSGGQQQLLGIAKLALTRPRLLLLDEPTKGLDASSRLQVARLLLDLARSGVTIVMATHDLAFAALVATSVTLLFDGQVACTEQACDFFTGNLFYRPVADGLVRRVLGEEGA